VIEYPSSGAARRGSRGRLARASGLLVGPALALALTSANPAAAAVPHTVGPGETLSSIAGANGLGYDSLAAWNGLDSEALLVEGQTIEVPTLDEAVATGVAVAPSSTPTSVPSTTGTTVGSEPAAPAPASWLAPVETLEGTAYLDFGVAASWEAMRQESIASYGIDLYPAGTLSAYRSLDQQAYLYDLYLSGLGAPANPPGSSSHERGVAVDVADEAMASVVEEIGPSYGFVATIPGEWWHFEWLG